MDGQIHTSKKHLHRIVANRTFIVSFSLMPSERVSPILKYSWRLKRIHAGIICLDFIDAEAVPTRLCGLNHHHTRNLREIQGGSLNSRCLYTIDHNEAIQAICSRTESLRWGACLRVYAKEGTAKATVFCLMTPIKVVDAIRDAHIGMHKLRPNRRSQNLLSSLVWRCWVLGRCPGLRHHVKTRGVARQG